MEMDERILRITVITAAILLVFTAIGVVYPASVFAIKSVDAYRAACCTGYTSADPLQCPLTGCTCRNRIDNIACINQNGIPGAWAGFTCGQAFRMGLCVGPAGACCVKGGGGCTYPVDRYNCNRLNNWWYKGKTCETACVPKGACCKEGHCSFRTGANCDAIEGDYQGNGVKCVAGLCPKYGACCYPDSSCLYEQQGVCEIAHGLYKGDGKKCSPNPCGIGACCYNSGTCSILPASQCKAEGGTYKGAGKQCSAVKCPVKGACCSKLSGQCHFMLKTSCKGVYMGDAKKCEEVEPCPTEGACCFGGLGDLGCRDAFSKEFCIQDGGRFKGIGTSCTQANICPEYGACCLMRGHTCVSRKNSDACGANNLWMGPSSTRTPCTPNPCPTPSSSSSTSTTTTTIPWPSTP